MKRKQVRAAFCPNATVYELEATGYEPFVLVTCLLLGVLRPSETGTPVSLGCNSFHLAIEKGRTRSWAWRYDWQAALLLQA